MIKRKKEVKNKIDIRINSIHIQIDIRINSIRTDVIFELFILTLETIRGYLFATNDNRKGP